MRSMAANGVRHLLVGLAALMLAGPLAAQSFPTKPMELVIPWPPGGRTDIMVRMLAPYLEKELGQPVVVINKVGGGGLTGMAFIKAAKPDGYVFSSGGIALSSMQYEKKTDISLWDYTWFMQVYSTPLVAVVPSGSRFKTLGELVAHAKANPRSVKHGNTGTGSSTHLASESLARRLDIKLTQVPYRGEGPAVIGVAGGEADFSLGLMVAFRSLIEDGKLRVLGIAAAARDPALPQVPTFREQGIDFEYLAFETLHVPNGTPQAIVDRLAQAGENALNNPELKAKFESVGLNAAPMRQAAFTQWLRGWDEDVKALMKEIGLYARD